MTSKAIFYYSLTGNTKSLVQTLDDLSAWDVYDLTQLDPEEVNFAGYQTILIGSMTLGRGTPPGYFKKLLSKLVAIERAHIGLFGSGQSHYGEVFFCGALDVLEDLLKQRNHIYFKLKFESYPTFYVKEKFNRLVKEMEVCHETVEV